MTVILCSHSCHKITGYTKVITCTHSDNGRQCRCCCGIGKGTWEEQPFAQCLLKFYLLPQLVENQPGHNGRMACLECANMWGRLGHLRGAFPGTGLRVTARIARIPTPIKHSRLAGSLKQQCSKHYKNINGCNGREMAEVTVISERRIQHCGVHTAATQRNIVSHPITKYYKEKNYRTNGKLLRKWQYMKHGPATCHELGVTGWELVIVVIYR